MASILDTGFASIFTGILIFLLVYAIVWGVLSWRKPLGNSMGANAIIAFVVALLVAITPAARYFIQFITPWYIMLALALFFILFIVSMFGVSGEHDFKNIIMQPRVYVWVVILAIVILLFGLGNTFGQSALGTEPTPSVVPGPEYQVIGGQYAQPGVLAPNPYSYPYSTGVPQPGQPGATATGDFGTNMMNTIFHPKVLGLIALFIIGAVAVFFLSQP